LGWFFFHYQAASTLLGGLDRQMGFVVMKQDRYLCLTLGTRIRALPYDPMPHHQNLGSESHQHSSLSQLQCLPSTNSLPHPSHPLSYLFHNLEPFNALASAAACCCLCLTFIPSAFFYFSRHFLVIWQYSSSELESQCFFLETPQQALPIMMNNQSRFSSAVPSCGCQHPEVGYSLLSFFRLKCRFFLTSHSLVPHFICAKSLFRQGQYQLAQLCHGPSIRCLSA